MNYPVGLNKLILIKIEKWGISNLKHAAWRESLVLSSFLKERKFS